MKMNGPTITRHRGKVCVPGLPFMYGAGYEGNPGYRYATHEHKTLAAGLRWLKRYAVVPGQEGKGPE